MYKVFASLLEKNHVTAYQVSKATGITESTFSDWKSGRSCPKLDKLRKIACYFQVSISYLLGECVYITPKDIVESVSQGRLSEELENKLKQEITKTIRAYLSLISIDENVIPIDITTDSPQYSVAQAFVYSETPPAATPRYIVQNAKIYDNSTSELKNYVNIVRQKHIDDTK